MEKVDEVLAQRGSVYGSYNQGTEFRARMMEDMEKMRLHACGIQYTEVERVWLNDLMMKVRRLAVSPDHIDSWTDLAGYSTLIIDHINGVELCDDMSKGLFNEQY